MLSGCYAAFWVGERSAAPEHPVNVVGVELRGPGLPGLHSAPLTIGRASSRARIVA